MSVGLDSGKPLWKVLTQLWCTLFCYSPFFLHAFYRWWPIASEAILGHEEVVWAKEPWAKNGQGESLKKKKDWASYVILEHL